MGDTTLPWFGLTTISQVNDRTQERYWEASGIEVNPLFLWRKRILVSTGLQPTF
jgi:hypothetical protein